MERQYDKLDDILGQEIVGYRVGEHSELMFLLDDGTILSWQGHYSVPKHSEHDGIAGVWYGENEDGEWITGEDQNGT